MVGRMMALLAVLLLAACAAPAAVGTDARTVRLSSEMREVSGIRAVELLTSGRLAISQATEERLTVDAEQDVLPYLTSEVVDGVLRLGAKEGTRILSEKHVVYRLSAPGLERLTVAGSGWATFAAMRTPSFRLELTGSGNVKLDGVADAQDVLITGSGHYTGDGLRSKTVTARVEGSGKMVVRAAEKLDATITGSGSIAYYGDPAVTRNVTGAGTVVQLR